MDSENLDFDDDSPPEPQTRALTIAPPSRRPRREQVGRTPPHNIEAEEYLLSCCLMDGAATLSQAESAGVTARTFYSSAAGVIFDRMRQMHAAGKLVDLLTVSQEMIAKREIEQVGGYPYLLQISSSIPTTAQADYFIEKIRDAEKRREVIHRATALAEAAYSHTGDGLTEALAGPIDQLHAVITGGDAAGTEAESIMNFDWPDADDPNILLGNDDYLGRGGQLLFVSYAGAGKSSSIMDAVMTWAIGLPWFGIKCNGPLKTLVIQAEDSRRYVGKISRSFREANNLTAAQLGLLRSNVVIKKIKGVCGDAFLAQVRSLVAKHKPDLVVVNPAYLYAEGDLGRAECAQPFLVGLDAINRDEKFAYIIVHHTGKPAPKDNKGARVAVEDWESIYMGFGSSYLANWPRCSILLERKPGDGDRYTLKLGKAGKNAGVVKEVDHDGVKRFEATTQIPIRFSRERRMINGKDRNLVYWEYDDEEDAPKPESQGRGGPRENSGRASKFAFQEFTAALRTVCGGEDKRQPFAVLHRKAGEVAPVAKTTFYDLVKKALDTGELIRHADSKYYVPKV